MKTEKISINGVNLYSFASFDDIIAFAEEKKGILVAMNAGKIGHSTPEMQDIINNNIGYADGMAAVWALKKKGVKNAVKLPGCELWLKIIEKKYKDSSFYIVGGTQDVIEKTINRLKQEYEGINIVGYRNGYLKIDEEINALENDIVSKQPSVVFMAMGSPKQELLMKRFLQKHHTIYQGLGGSLDVYTGKVERAPEWLIRWNLEGPYRVLRDFSKWRRFVFDLGVIVKIKLGIMK